MRQRCSAHQEKMDLHSSIIPADNVKFRKGLYVSLACTQCRANHRRCNGQAPCSRCEKANLDCIYTKTRPRGGNRSKKNQHNNDKNIYDNDGKKFAFFRLFKAYIHQTRPQISLQNAFLLYPTPRLI